MDAPFDPRTLQLLRAEEEVEIETRAGPQAAPRRTIIWVVVDEQGRVFVRSVRGPAGRWYREAVAHPACVLHVSESAIPITALPAADPEDVAACSAALRVKYARDGALRSMLREATLPTTLRLLPR
jgi:hypothetical protein